MMLAPPSLKLPLAVAAALLAEPSPSLSLASHSALPAAAQGHGTLAQLVTHRPRGGCHGD